MGREILRGMKGTKAEDGRTEYIPPKEKDPGRELFARLMEFQDNKDVWQFMLWGVWIKEEFESLVGRIDSMVGNMGDNLHSQMLLDTLTNLIGLEYENIRFPKTKYLTAVVQVLFNRNYSDRFTIDIRGWPDRWGYDAGWYLEGRKNRPLTLEMWGNISFLGGGAEYCKFILHDNIIGGCAHEAKHCDFTFYSKVKECSLRAEHCRFDQMPSAEIEEYWGNLSQDNIRRRMNENGIWEIIG